MDLNKNQEAFMALVRAGLWEKKVRLLPYNDIDYSQVLRIAEEQAIVGLITVGLEHVQDVKVSQTVRLLFIGRSMQIEQTNLAMNHYLVELFGKLRNENIYAVLLKGQGIAQCYERPLWRACGDVDLLLLSNDYERAKSTIITMTQPVVKENTKTLEYCANVESYMVELHGTLHCQLSKRMDDYLDKIQKDICKGGEVRVWSNNGYDVFLPSPNNDVIVVFSHIVKHFFREGIGLRQICDLCRLLWTFRNEIDYELLEKRLKEMQLLSEWQAFAAFAVEYLGMPVEVLPLYSPKKKWLRKAKRILVFVFETGNFGHNRDISYYDKYPWLIYKAISLKRHTSDFIKQFMIFPRDSVTAWRSMMSIGIEEVKKRRFAYE